MKSEPRQKVTSMAERCGRILVAAGIAASLLPAPCVAQPDRISTNSATTAADNGTPAAVPAARTGKARAPVHYLPNRLPRRANMFYEGAWGVDSLKVKAVESGELIRFSWRVLEPSKAVALNDKKAEPLLLDPQAGVKLVVPTMEKVGQLRQASTPEGGKSYWMAFSNPGRRVKPGDRVSIVIGQFHAIGLVVE
jgi:hypothetical protein